MNNLNDTEPIYMLMFKDEIVKKTIYLNTNKYIVQPISSFKRISGMELYTKDWGRIPYKILSKLIDRISLFYPKSKFTIGFYFNKNIITEKNGVSLWGVGYNNRLLRFFRRHTIKMYKKTPEKILPALITDSQKIEQSLSFILVQANLLEKSSNESNFVQVMAPIFKKAITSLKSYSWRDIVCTKQEPCATQSMTETGKFLTV